MNKIIKKLVLLVLILITTFTLFSCYGGSANTYKEDTFVKTKFINKSSEYQIKDGEIDLLYLKDSGLPFVNIEEYLMLLDGLYLADEFEFVTTGNILNISVLITYNNKDYNETLIIDSSLNTLSATSLDFFDLYLERPETNYSENLISLETAVIEGDSVLFNLAKYDFEIIKLDESFYMPLVITNLIFNQSNYFDTYYNGEVIYGIDTSNLDEEAIKSILKSPANRKQISQEMKVHDYNFNRFIIDYFYGLKKDRGINESSSFINKKDFLKDSNRAIYDVVKKLDDLHTSHMTRGYLDNRNLKTTYPNLTNGPIVSKFYNDLSKVQREAINYFGIKNNYIDFKTHEYIDNNETLIIYVLEFTVNTPNEIESIIKNAKNETKNIIIDLSFNTGGNLGAVLRMFALMTNEKISYHFLNPLNNEKATYNVRGERPAYDNYNYFLKTSSVTFSAANLASSIAKELGIKVMGRKSSGGASAISFFVFPTGSITIMSSNTVLTNQEYQSIEKGIEVDYHLNNLYDPDAITKYLKWIKLEKNYC